MEIEQASQYLIRRVAQYIIEGKGPELIAYLTALMQIPGMKIVFQLASNNLNQIMLNPRLVQMVNVNVLQSVHHFINMFQQFTLP